MMQNDFMPNVIGQTQLKKQFSMFARNFMKTGINPFFCLEGPRGYGKTMLTREYCKELKDPQGRPRPLMEINAAELTCMKNFIEIWFPKMRENNAALFIDEAHLLDIKKFQSPLLTICEESKSPIRHYKYEDREEGERTCTFDFREYCIFFATTDQQKLVGPLKDRLEPLAISHYSEDELWQIFELGLECTVSDQVKDEIISIFRGHPRSCVKLAKNLNSFAVGVGSDYINQVKWKEFRDLMGIHDYGLTEQELNIIKVLGNGPLALQDIAAKTEYSKGVIQHQYELQIKKKGLIFTDGKRHLTSKGHTFYRKTFL